MWLSLASIAAMAIMFLYMVNKARFASTRRLALIPMAACGMEILAAGMLTPGLFPLLTAALVCLRAVILGCCVAAMRRDAAMARVRARRRVVVRNEACLQAQGKIRPLQRNVRCA